MIQKKYNRDVFYANWIWSSNTFSPKFTAFLFAEEHHCSFLKNKCARARSLFVPVRLSGRKNLRSACLIARISGRFFGPLIPAGELARVRRFFRSARRDLRFPRIGRYFDNDDGKTRRANEAENSVLDATSVEIVVTSCPHRANRIIDGNFQTRNMWTLHVARGLELAVAADARDNSRAVLGLLASTLAAIIRDRAVSLTLTFETAVIWEVHQSSSGSVLSHAFNLIELILHILKNYTFFPSFLQASEVIRFWIYSLS